jgi:hypothetical protein
MAPKYGFVIFAEAAGIGCGQMRCPVSAGLPD